MKSRITKAVFPVAGMGTRFLPATKASPKEMLPIVDKPLIQYAVEEALEAGITELIFITGRNKRAIEDHFDKAYELENELELRNKQKLLDTVQGILPRAASCIYIRQPVALGLGHAVLCARPAVGDEPFAVILADDMIQSEIGAMQQMTQLFESTGASILGVENVPREQTSQYGIIETTATPLGQQVCSIVEKPRPEDARSTLAVVGRYILTPRVFDRLATLSAGAGGEIQLTDGIAALLRDEPVLALPLQGERYDCGSKLGYLKATVQLARQHPEVGAAFQQWLRDSNFSASTPSPD